MTDDQKLAALAALAHAPFVITCAAFLVVAILVAVWAERGADVDYMAPWSDREPGDLS